LAINLEPVNRWIINNRKKSSSRHGRQYVLMEENDLERERKRREVRSTLQMMLG